MESLTIYETLKNIEDKKISIEELLKLYISRIKENNNLNIFIHFDENIIYDSNYAGFSEIQNETHPRIQENTPNTKIIHNFHSIEDDMARAVEVQNSGDSELAQLMLQQTAEKGTPSLVAFVAAVRMPENARSIP